MIDKYEEWFDSVPLEEDCLKAGEDPGMQAKECEIMIDYIQRVIPVPENIDCLIHFKKNRNHHEFGLYYDIVIWFNENQPEEIFDACVKYINQVVKNYPERWDEIAIKKLKEIGYVRSPVLSNS